MKERDGALELGEAEVRIEGGKLRTLQQRLVHDRAAGHRGHVEAGQPDRVRLLLHGAPREEQGTLPCVVVGRGLRPPDQHLPDHRLALARTGAECRRVDRHVAPANERKSVPRQHALDQGDGLCQRVRVDRQEVDANRERLAGLEAQSQAVGIAVEQSMGYLGQQPRAIARVVGGRGAAMGHARHRLEGHLHDLVGAAPGRLGHEADTTGIVLPEGIESSRLDDTRVRVRFRDWPSGSAAQVRPCFPPSQSWRLAGEASLKNKNPARAGAGSGARHHMRNYPVAPGERGVLARIALAT